MEFYLSGSHISHWNPLSFTEPSWWRYWIRCWHSTPSALCARHSWRNLPRQHDYSCGTLTLDPFCKLVKSCLLGVIQCDWCAPTALPATEVIAITFDTQLCFFQLKLSLSIYLTARKNLRRRAVVAYEKHNHCFSCKVLKTPTSLRPTGRGEYKFETSVFSLPIECLNLHDSLGNADNCGHEYLAKVAVQLQSLRFLFKKQLPELCC